jgi:hypothetical protein
VRRRDFIALLGFAANWPLTARAQQERKIPRIGILSPSRSEDASPNRVTLKAFVAGLSELGYVDGQNITIERELSEANTDRLHDAAAELVKHNVDVIVTLSTTAARPAKQATSLIPIVAIGMADPVDDELVASLARPGGNVTGTTFLGPQLVTKRLQLLSEVVPQHSRVAILWHAHAYSDRTMDGMVKEAKNAAPTLGMQLQFVPANSPEEITAAFSTRPKDATCLRVGSAGTLRDLGNKCCLICSTTRLNTPPAAPQFLFARGATRITLLARNGIVGLLELLEQLGLYDGEVFQNVWRRARCSHGTPCEQSPQIFCVQGRELRYLPIVVESRGLL